MRNDLGVPFGLALVTRAKPKGTPKSFRIAYSLQFLRVVYIQAL